MRVKRPHNTNKAEFWIPIVILVIDGDPSSWASLPVSRKLGVPVQVLAPRGPDESESKLSELRNERLESLGVLGMGWINNHLNAGTGIKMVVVDRHIRIGDGLGVHEPVIK
jgi:hypothetical protein